MFLLESDIPDFLRSSEYLQALLSEGPFPEVGIEIPDGYLKKNLSIHTQFDLIEVLDAIRFWLLPDLLNDSMDLIRYAFNPKNQADFLTVVADVCDIPIIKELREILMEPEDKLCIATQFGRIHVIQFLIEDTLLPVTEAAGIVAISECKFACLVYFRSRGLKLTKNMCIAAGTSGKIQSVHYVIKNSTGGLGHVSEGCAVGDHFECLKYAIEHTHKYDRTAYRDNIMKGFEVAALKGNIALLVKMRREWQDPVYDMYDRSIVFYGAHGGHLEVLQFAQQNNFAMCHFQSAVRTAAGKGHMHCLKFLYELGVLATEEDVRSAACSGQLSALQFLFEHNCPKSASICEHLALFNHLTCLTFAHENGCPWDERTCSVAASMGHLDCLKYAYEQGCPWRARKSHSTESDPSTLEKVTGAGEEEANEELKSEEEENEEYEDEDDDEDDEYEDEDDEYHDHDEDDEQVYGDITVAAAQAPNADCLQYVLEQGVPLHPGLGRVATVRPAALQFLRARGITWDKEELRARGLTWDEEDLYKHGITWDKEDCAEEVGNLATPRRRAHPRSEAVRWNNEELLQYTSEHGGPSECQTAEVVTSAASNRRRPLEEEE